MRNLKLLFGLLIFITAYNTASAQETVMKDVSEAYVAKLVARAEANYPLVKSNQNRINIAQGAVGKAKTSYLESFTFSYIYQPNGVNTLNSAGNKNANYTFNGIQAGIYFNLGTFLERPYVVKEARQQLEIANNDQEQYFLTLTNQVKKRYYTYVGAIALLKLATQSTIDAQSVSNDIKHKFEKGEDTFDNYTKSQNSLTTTFQAKVQAETALLIAKADLEELLGEKLENIQ
jgi:outer membrane protein TolC